MRNEWFDAAQFLQKADEQHEHKHPEVLMRLAVAYSKMNASGAAMLSLERLLQLRGMENYKTAQLQLARLYIKHKRSEEHTSELQSLVNLVCRLLLEKKKKNKTKQNKRKGKERSEEKQ